MKRRTKIFLVIGMLFWVTYVIEIGTSALSSPWSIRNIDQWLFVFHLTCFAIVFVTLTIGYMRYGSTFLEKRALLLEKSLSQAPKTRFFAWMFWIFIAIGLVIIFNVVQSA